MEFLSTSGLPEPDTEILDKLFTLFDLNGEQVVNYKDFLAGCSILQTGSVIDKLRLCLDIYDSSGTGIATRTELKRALISVNNTACYFGDPVLKDEEISNIIMDLFKKANAPTSSLPIEEYIGQIYDHQLTIKFLLGQGTVRFGSK